MPDAGMPESFGHSRDWMARTWIEEVELDARRDYLDWSRTLRAEQRAEQRREALWHEERGPR